MKMFNKYLLAILFLFSASVYADWNPSVTASSGGTFGEDQIARDTANTALSNANTAKSNATANTDALTNHKTDAGAQKHLSAAEKAKLHDKVKLDPASSSALTISNQTLKLTLPASAVPRTSFQATPTDTAIVSEKLVKDSLDAKESKLDATVFNAVGSENVIGINQNTTTLQKLAVKLNAYNTSISPSNLKAGVGAPGSGIGANGDYYLQLDVIDGTNDIWGAKAGGAWPAQADAKSTDITKAADGDIIAGTDDLVKGHSSKQLYTEIKKLSEDYIVFDTMAEAMGSVIPTAKFIQVGKASNFSSLWRTNLLVDTVFVSNDSTKFQCLVGCEAVVNTNKAWVSNDTSLKAGDRFVQVRHSDSKRFIYEVKSNWADGTSTGATWDAPEEAKFNALSEDKADLISLLIADGYANGPFPPADIDGFVRVDKTTNLVYKKINGAYTLLADISFRDGMILAVKSTDEKYKWDKALGIFKPQLSGGLRGAPVADVAELTALTAMDDEFRHEIAGDKDYRFKMTARLTPAEIADVLNLADDAATGKWIKQGLLIENKETLILSSDGWGGNGAVRTLSGGKTWADIKFTYDKIRISAYSPRYNGEPVAWGDEVDVDTIIAGVNLLEATDAGVARLKVTSLTTGNLTNNSSSMAASNIRIYGVMSGKVVTKPDELTLDATVADGDLLTVDLASKKLVKYEGLSLVSGRMTTLMGKRTAGQYFDIGWSSKWAYTKIGKPIAGNSFGYTLTPGVWELEMNLVQVESADWLAGWWESNGSKSGNTATTDVPSNSAIGPVPARTFIEVPMGQTRTVKFKITDTGTPQKDANSTGGCTFYIKKIR